MQRRGASSVGSVWIFMCGFASRAIISASPPPCLLARYRCFVYLDGI